MTKRMFVALICTYRNSKDGISTWKLREFELTDPTPPMTERMFVASVYKSQRRNLGQKRRELKGLVTTQKTTSGELFTFQRPSLWSATKYVASIRGEFWGDWVRVPSFLVWSS